MECLPLKCQLLMQEVQWNGKKFGPDGSAGNVYWILMSAVLELFFKQLFLGLQERKTVSMGIESGSSAVDGVF